MTASRNPHPGQPPRPVKASTPRLVNRRRWMSIDDWLNSTGNSAVRVYDTEPGKCRPEELPGTVAEVFGHRR